MRIDEGARSVERELCNGERASAALRRKRKGRGRQTLSVEVKIRLASLLCIYRSTELCSPKARLACINCRLKPRSLMGGTHHDRGGCTHACALSLRRGNRRVAAGRHVRLPTSPTTRAAAAPEKARPRHRTVPATARIKWPGPLPSKDYPRAARALGSKNLTLEECDYRPVASKPARRERAPQVPSVYKKLLISGSRACLAENPRNLQMRKDGGTQLPPRNGPTDQGFET
jgi:hypothetical protein